MSCGRVKKKKSRFYKHNEDHNCSVISKVKLFAFNGQGQTLLSERCQYSPWCSITYNPSTKQINPQYGWYFWILNIPGLEFFKMKANVFWMQHSWNKLMLPCSLKHKDILKYNKMSQVSLHKKCDKLWIRKQWITLVAPTALPGTMDQPIIAAPVLYAVHDPKS